VREAVESAIPLRRCSKRVGRRAEIGGDPCLPALLGAAACPCSGHCAPDAYATLVACVVRGLDDDPDALLEPLACRMAALAREERYEEAAITRDRLGALARALERERLVRAVRAAGHVVLDDAHGTIEIDGGRLVEGGLLLGPAEWDWPVRRDEIDELLVVARWLFGPARGLRRVQRVDGTLASVFPALPRYAPTRSAAGALR
jgi:hypothetical protein